MSIKHMTRREFLRVTTLSGLGLVVAACAPQVAPTSAPASSASASSSAPSAAATAVPKPTQGPKSGGVLKIATTTDATGLGNPPSMLTTQDFVTSKTCVESLGRFDPSGVMVPWLADNWKMDATAKTITVTLKKGIKFHDGTDFNAAACKWNIDHFVGAKRAELPGVKSVEAVDDSTVRITLANWDNTALIGMAYFAGPQISPTAWQKAGSTDKERDDWAVNNPTGTGPFMFVSRQKDVKQVYKRFDGYWKGKPYLDGIEWNFIVDPVTATASFKAKEVDVIWSLTPLVARDLKASGVNITELKTGMGLVMMGIMPNSALPDSPFTKLQARQAISYALDTKAILDTQFFGFATATQQWGVPGGYWANPKFTGYPFNPDKAKQLVTEAGFPNGIKTKFLVNNTPENVAVATAIQGMLAKANINAELDVADNARYRQLTSQTNFEGLCLASYRADSDLALVMPRNLSANGTIMQKSIMHPEKIEKMLTEAKQAPDQDSKRAKIWELQQVVFEEFSIFSPMLVLSGLAAKQPYVKGDGMMEVELTQWTPEIAWLDK
ncbi:MAG: ABC transporter substrate-binding protein [Chloroflexi bacterium]|nr:ABC transporter substrate-binding protein [Chloroflexota bacterium]